MDYSTIKLVHQTVIGLSISGFVLRGLAVLVGAGWVRSRAARTLPHIVDTVLLLTGLLLAWTLRLTPTAAPWLVAKLAGLLLYIAFGVVALRPGVALPLRVGAWLGALLTVGWIVSVAISKDPGGFLAWL